MTCGTPRSDSQLTSLLPIIDTRMTLVEFIRDGLGLTGTHVGVVLVTAVHARFCWTARP